MAVIEEDSNWEYNQMLKVLYNASMVEKRALGIPVTLANVKMTSFARTTAGVLTKVGLRAGSVEFPR